MSLDNTFESALLHITNVSWNRVPTIESVRHRSAYFILLIYLADCMKYSARTLSLMPRTIVATETGKIAVAAGSKKVSARRNTSAQAWANSMMSQEVCSLCAC